MSNTTARLSKRVRKPTSKAKASAVQRRGRPSHASADSTLMPVSTESSLVAASPPISIAEQTPASLSELQHKLLSLRQQVALLRNHVSIPVSSAINLSSYAANLPIHPPPIMSSQPFPTVLTSSTQSSTSSSLTPSFQPPFPPSQPPSSNWPGSASQNPPRPPSPLSAPTFSSPHQSHSVSSNLPLPAEELLAARDSDSDSDTGESSAIRASKKLHKKTMSLSGSLGNPLFGGGGFPSFDPPGTDSIEPRLKLRIQKNLFVPFEVLVAADQNKSVHHYLKNPFLTPHNDPKLRVFYPRLTSETWADGLNIFMLIWTEVHPEDAIPLMQYMKMIRGMAKVFPSSVWLGYDREFHILRQRFPNLAWNIPLPQIHFQLLMKTSPFGGRLPEPGSFTRDKGWGADVYRDKSSWADSGRSLHLNSVEPAGKLAYSKSYRHGFCTHFNLHGICRRPPKCASLAHRCSVCEGPHAAVHCRRPITSSAGGGSSHSTQASTSGNQKLGSSKAPATPARN